MTFPRVPALVVAHGYKAYQALIQNEETQQHLVSGFQPNSSSDNYPDDDSSEDEDARYEREMQQDLEDLKKQLLELIPCMYHTFPTLLTFHIVSFNTDSCV